MNVSLAWSLVAAAGQDFILQPCGTVGVEVAFGAEPDPAAAGVLIPGLAIFRRESMTGDCWARVPPGSLAATGSINLILGTIL